VWARRSERVSRKGVVEKFEEGKRGEVRSRQKWTG
jgi:hypothetical protein